jgi:hypothetical protein
MWLRTATALIAHRDGYAVCRRNGRKSGNNAVISAGSGGLNRAALPHPIFALVVPRPNSFPPLEEAAAVQRLARKMLYDKRLNLAGYGGKPLPFGLPPLRQIINREAL